MSYQARLKQAAGFKDDLSRIQTDTELVKMRYGDLLTPEENNTLSEYDKKLEAMRLRAVASYNKVLHL